MIKKEERSSFSLFYPRGCLLRGSVAEEGERERGKGRKRDRDLVGGGVAETWQSRYERHSGQGGWEQKG